MPADGSAFVPLSLDASSLLLLLGRRRSLKLLAAGLLRGVCHAQRVYGACLPRCRGSGHPTAGPPSPPSAGRHVKESADMTEMQGRQIQLPCHLTKCPSIVDINALTTMGIRTIVIMQR